MIPCILMLSLALATAEAPKTEALANPQAPDAGKAVPQDSTKVEGRFVIPKDVASFEGKLVEIRLYKYDPRMADQAADLVEKVEIKNFSHTLGKETKKDFVIGSKGILEPAMSYYVTFFILDGDQRTHLGKCEHDKDGIGKVLTNGLPKNITIAVAAIK